MRPPLRGKRRRDVAQGWLGAPRIRGKQDRGRCLNERRLRVPIAAHEVAARADVTGSAGTCRRPGVIRYDGVPLCRCVRELLARASTHSAVSSPTVGKGRLGCKHHDDRDQQEPRRQMRNSHH